MKFAFSVLILFFVLLNKIEVFGTEIEINLQIADSNYTIGDKIMLKSHLSFDDTLTLIVPDIPDNFGGLEVLELDYNLDSTFFSLSLISFDTGNFILPPIPFVFERKYDNYLFSKQAPSTTIRVNNIANEVNTIREIDFEKFPETSIS
jgi:hypothetical protein